MPLPVIHKAIYSLPPSDNLLRLFASSSGNTHNLLQISLASASLATSVILALSGSDPFPLSTPRSLAVTFAPVTFALLVAHTLLAIEYTPALLAAVALPLTLVGLLLHVLVLIRNTRLHTPSAAAASASGSCRRLVGSGSHHCHQM